MEKLARILAFVAALWVSNADAQTQYPTTLPASTVWGRLGIGAGPGQAVPFNILTANLLQQPLTAIPSVNIAIAPATNIPNSSLGYTQLGIGVTSTSDNASCTCPTPGQNIPSLAVVQQNFGGSNINNGRDAFVSFLNMTAPTSASNPYRFYVAGVFQANANTPDNGTVGTPAGEIEGVTSLVQLQSGATNWVAAIGAEHSMAITGTVRQKAALLLDNIPGDTSHGSVVDTLIWSYAFTGTVGFNTGWQIDSNGGLFALSSTGTVIKLVSGYTIGTGFDFGTGTVSGNVLQWASSAWLLAGNGNATLNAITAASLNASGTVSGANGTFTSGTVTATTGTYSGNVTAANITAAWSAYTASPACGSATITTNASRFLATGKTTKAQLDLTITALGSCTTSVTFTLPNTANSGGGLVGRTSTGKTINCFVTATSNSAGCTTSAALTTETVVLSGVYENQ